MDERFVDLLRSYLPHLGDRPLTEDTRLRDLGMDSIRAVDLLLGIEDAFRISLPDEELTDATFATAGGLWRAVASVLASTGGSSAALGQVS
jgi:acyl carrier protein